ncbi:hypothetical protein O0L34_g8541 [Tuta absoluta]|nr:hypothetical protein O0L34_g8541 [Tuta absoluta]
MPLDIRRAEALLFNYETTARTDYREIAHLTDHAPTIQRVTKKEKPREKEKPHTSTAPKYIGCMTEWKNKLPFNILHKPKEITQVHPMTPQPVFEKVIDEQREAVQKTRPRLNMVPAISLDDVTNSEHRDILIKNMYTAEMKERMEDAAGTYYVSIKAPMPDLPAPARPLYLPKLKPPVVPKEWRMDSVTWDRKQLRSAVDPTLYFWRRPEQAPPRCIVCEQTKRAAELCHQNAMKCQKM